MTGFCDRYCQMHFPEDEKNDEDPRIAPPRHSRYERGITALSHHPTSALPCMTNTLPKSIISVLQSEDRRDFINSSTFRDETLDNAQE